MDSKGPDKSTVFDILGKQRTPEVIKLLDLCSFQQEQIHYLEEQVQALKDEIARLKGLKPKPDIKPSTLEEDPQTKKKKKRSGKRAGSAKRRKTKKLPIHETITIEPDEVPEGSEFKGYQRFTVQDIIIRNHNTVYRLACYKTPAGEYLVGKLPEEIRDSHFGPLLTSFTLYQYYHAHVTQPLIWEQLREFGIDISSGQVNRIITEGKERFHEEKEAILRVGLMVSSFIHVDDTGARHQGRNGYCTHIGNEYFAWFESTESKSRINFLKLLRAGHEDYVLNDVALEYMRAQKLPQYLLVKLVAQGQMTLSEASFQATLNCLEITGERHVRIVTEGALLGSVIEHGVDPSLGIMSDDAGQFNVLLHALCWIHAERILNKLVGFNDEQREALEQVRSQVWQFYADLKVYKEAPDETKKAKLEARFDELFTTKTCFTTLNLALQRIHKNKKELLLVLEHPEIPLNNNLSERDIREYVKRRKVSGSTRSDAGRRCRDTFTSLKKTCRKLGISFWEYLQDRVSALGQIPPLNEVIYLQARAPPD